MGIISLRIVKVEIKVILGSRMDTSFMIKIVSFPQRGGSVNSSVDGVVQTYTYISWCGPRLRSLSTPNHRASICKFSLVSRKKVAS